MTLLLRRRMMNLTMTILAFLSALIALVPLFFILTHVVSKGASALNADFFTQLPLPVGEVGGGVAHAIIGTLFLVGVGTLLSLPIGIFAGMFLAENGATRFSRIVRFSADMLNGTPSIVIGVFVYAILVVPFGGFSAISGSVALAIIMIPMLVRTTEEMIKLVPHSLREAALALGVPYWKMLWSIVLRTARSGIVTGLLLSIARIAGETAPLLFTALGNQFWSQSLFEPIAALPLMIFTYAISPFEEWQRQAWAGALLLIMMVVGLNVASRLFFRQTLKGKRS